MFQERIPVKEGKERVLGKSPGRAAAARLSSWEREGGEGNTSRGIASVTLSIAFSPLWEPEGKEQS